MVVELIMAAAIIFLAIALLIRKEIVFKLNVTVEHKSESNVAAEIDTTRMLAELTKEEVEMYKNQPSVIGMLNELLSTGEIKDKEDRNDG
jgi:hypothetical protein